MAFFRGFTRKKLFTSASAKKRKKEQDCFLKNGSAVLEELLTLCDGNCRIPIRYFSATEIEMAIKHSENKLEFSNGYMVTGSLNKRRVLVRFNTCYFDIIHRDIAVTAQMSHLKNVLRLVGCCLEFEQLVMVYEYVVAITLDELLFNKGNTNDHARKSLSWGKRLRIANEVASAIVYLHTEFTTPIIHRNIKPHKVIIDQNSGVAKIVDFSLSISLPPGELEVEDAVWGTFCYIDPEYAISGIVTQKTDVYSFGVLLFELLTGKNMCEMTNTVDRAISEKRSDFEDPNPSTVFELYIKESNVMDIADSAIVEEHGIEIQQQLEDYMDLVKKCTADKGEDRPYMIHVARELRRIEKCFRALTLGQN